MKISLISGSNTLRGKVIIFAILLLILSGGSTFYFLSVIKSSKSDLLTIEDTIKNETAQSATDRTELLAKEQQKLTVAIWITSGSGLVLLIVLSSGAYIIIVSLRNSVNNLQLILDHLVKGDTSINLSSGKDEFALLISQANQLGENLKQSSVFATSIGEGNTDAEFKALSEKDELGNALVQMRAKLKAINEADQKRNWSREGLARFTDFIRRDEDYEKLADLLIGELVRHTGSNQGGVFTLNRDDEKDHFLELTACYAFDRKKFMHKRVETGEGLLGQCYLEGQTIHLRKIPKDYVAITSGLGGAQPSSVLVVPMKVNDVSEGVLELASYKKYEPHEVEFVERVAEIIASTISNARVAQRTKRLLEESQQQSEQMRAQEEEMRQNMEEMHATQELLERQATETKKIHDVLEIEKTMFNVLMEFLPDRITYKDRESRILRINKAKALRLNMTSEEVVGKTDYDFFAKEHAEKAMREEKVLLDSGKPLLDTEERLTFTNGDVSWVSTSRIPFKNEHQETSGMFIITKDITRQKEAELRLHDKEKILRSMLENMPVFYYKIANGIVEESWTNIGSEFPDSLQLKSRRVEEIFPEVAKSIGPTGLENKVCLTKHSIEGAVLTIKHYIFSDSTRLQTFWVYSLLMK